MADISADDKDLVIRTLLGEAAKEGPDGQAAVAHTIMNRVAAGKYGATPSDVVMARGQFEPWSTRSRELLSYSPDSPSYKAASKVLDGVISGDIPDPTGGATHFLNPNIVKDRRGGTLPSWAQGDPTATIGNHAFFAPDGPAKPVPVAATPGEDLLKLYGGGASAPVPAPPSSASPGSTAGPTNLPAAPITFQNAPPAPPSPLSDDALLQTYATTPASASPTSPPADNRSVIDKLTGTGGPRYQTWPERAIRSVVGSGNALMDQAYSGEPFDVGDVLNVAGSTLGTGASANAFRIQRAGAGTAGGGLFASSVDAATNALAAKAGELGINIKPSQLGGPGTFVAKLDQMTGQMPFSGRKGEGALQGDQFTHAVSRTFGEDTPQITRETMQGAYKRIGGVMNDIEGRTTVPVGQDHQLMTSLGNIASDVERLYTKDSPQYKAVIGHMQDIFERAAPYGDTLPGDVYKSLVTHNSDLDKLAGSGEPIARFGTQIKEALRDAMQRAATPEDAAAYRQARLQYKNAKTIEPLVIKGVPGEINPVTLQNRVAQQFGIHDAGELGALADIGQKFMRQPRDSGTPIGTAILHALTSPVGLGAEAATALGGAHYLGADPVTLGLMGLGGGAGFLASGAIARGTHALLASPGNKLINRTGGYALPIGAHNALAAPPEPLRITANPR